MCILHSFNALIVNCSEPPSRGMHAVSAGGRFCVPLREKEVSPRQRIETLHVTLTCGKRHNVPHPAEPPTTPGCPTAMGTDGQRWEGCSAGCSERDTDDRNIVRHTHTAAGSVKFLKHTDRQGPLPAKALQTPPATSCAAVLCRPFKKKKVTVYDC